MPQEYIEVQGALESGNLEVQDQRLQYRRLDRHGNP
jgi:hypothetical protein